MSKVKLSAEEKMEIVRQYLEFSYNKALKKLEQVKISDGREAKAKKAYLQNITELLEKIRK